MKKLKIISALSMVALLLGESSYAIIFTGPARRQAHRQQAEEAYMEGMVAGQEMHTPHENEEFKENYADDANVTVQALGDGHILAQLSPEEKTMIMEKIHSRMQNQGNVAIQAVAEDEQNALPAESETTMFQPEDTSKDAHSENSVQQVPVENNQDNNESMTAPDQENDAKEIHDHKESSENGALEEHLVAENDTEKKEETSSENHEEKPSSENTETQKTDMSQKETKHDDQEKSQQNISEQSQQAHPEIAPAAEGTQAHHEATQDVTPQPAPAPEDMQTPEVKPTQEVASVPATQEPSQSQQESHESQTKEKDDKQATSPTTPAPAKEQASAMPEHEQAHAAQSSDIENKTEEVAQVHSEEHVQVTAEQHATETPVVQGPPALQKAPEQIKIVKVYPVYEAAMRGIHNVKSAAVDMLNFIHAWAVEKLSRK